MRFLGYRGGESLDFDVLGSRPVQSDRWPMLLLHVPVRRYHSLLANRKRFQNCFTYILRKKMSFYKNNIGLQIKKKLSL